LATYLTYPVHGCCGIAIVGSSKHILAGPKQLQNEWRATLPSCPSPAVAKVLWRNQEKVIGGFSMGSQRTLGGAISQISQMKCMYRLYRVIITGVI